MSMLFPGQAPKKQLLTIELVPATSWFKNARTILTTAEWDKVRKQVYRTAGYLCEVCGGEGPKWPVECHEVWGFNDGLGIQKLERLQALCPDCHKVKHYGFAQIKGWEKQVFAHLCKVNEWLPAVAKLYVRDAFVLWNQRSKRTWQVDLRGMAVYGVDPYELDERRTGKSDSGSNEPEHDIME